MTEYLKKWCRMLSASRSKQVTFQILYYLFSPNHCYLWWTSRPAMLSTGVSCANTWAIIVLLLVVFPHCPRRERVFPASDIISHSICDGFQHCQPGTILTPDDLILNLGHDTECGSKVNRCNYQYLHGILKNGTLFGCIMLKWHTLAPFFDLFLCQSWQALITTFWKVLVFRCYETSKLGVLGVFTTNTA